MDFINLLCSAWPDGGFWPSIIKIFDFVGSYAWVIIVFTIVLKLVLSPLDFMQRYYTNKTTRAQAKLAPQLEKLKRQYGNNQNLLYQKQNELYKKSGINSRGSCVFMLVYLVLTLVIFITLFNSIQDVARFKVQYQYGELQKEYYTSYNVEYVRDYLGEDITGKEFKVYTDKDLETLENSKVQSIRTSESKTEEEAKTILASKKSTAKSNAQVLVVAKYGEIKDSWLWINNIWVADMPNQKAVLSYDAYVNFIRNKDIDKTVYEDVMGALLLDGSTYNVANGYFILSIIVLAVSFLSQYILRRTSQPKDKDGKPIPTPNSSKVMMFVMPFIMVMFTLGSSAIFAIYIITNSIMSTLLTPITIKLCNKIQDKQDEKEYNQTKVDYRR